MFLKLLASIVETLLSYGLYHVLKLVYQERNSPVRHLPGPPSNHFIYGSSKDLLFFRHAARAVSLQPNH
ncbi:hypothetical protein B0H14DRAFT_3450688 [Mycena olivaceomarginata]|nr:hypothetical protein B0H14DRAFT_3450688 [Mycena olivaceomarginata]